MTSNAQGAVDPTADVVANFLRWIPKQEHIKRQLALDAALYSRPFNQDDLEAYTYLPEHERPTLYHWLTEQPFVQGSAQDGRYHYHILAQELFSRHLYQRSRKDYYATRRALASYYQQQLAKVESEGGKEVHRSTEWLEPALALIYQLFLLPDELSHIKAIEQVLSTYSGHEHTGEVVRVLRDVSHKQPNNLASPRVQETAKHLLQYIEADLANQEQELLKAAGFLLEKVAHTPSFPPELLAHIYSKRGHAYGSLKEYEQAIEDFNHTLELVPHNVRAYIMRGFTCVFMNKYRRAIEDFDRALELSPASSMAYWLRGISYFSLGDYQTAIADYDHALELSPTSSMVYTKRGEAYSRLKEYERAIADYGRALKLNPKSAQTYTQRGETYRLLKEYDKAIADYDRAMTLDPGDAWTYVCKGFTYLWLKDIRQAIANYTYARELNPTNVNYGWMIEWSAMCLKELDSESAERLEAIAAHDPQCYEAQVCRGTALWLRKRFEEALVALGRAIVLHPEEWDIYDAYFWKGMVCISLEQDKEALMAVEKALALDLPPILLTPLRWFEQERPHFYEKYAVPLLAHYEVF